LIKPQDAAASSGSNSLKSARHGFLAESQGGAAKGGRRSKRPGCADLNPAASIDIIRRCDSLRGELNDD
jgi:hypothetical protein